MANQVRIDVVGLQSAMAKLRPALYWPAVVELLRSAALVGERALRLGSPRDTAALARSWASEVVPPMARVYTGLSYAETMDQGRRPGAKMPPPASLVGWISRHGLTGVVSPFVLARSIARRGIKGRFFVKAAAEAVERQLPALAVVAARRIERDWGA